MRVELKGGKGFKLRTKTLREKIVSSSYSMVLYQPKLSNDRWIKEVLPHFFLEISICTTFLCLTLILIKNLVFFFERKKFSFILVSY